jgi:hypothetical protein
VPADDHRTTDILATSRPTSAPTPPPMAQLAGPVAVTVVVPLRSPIPNTAIGSRLGALAAEVGEVLVVDGSPPPVQDIHARTWPQQVRHLRLQLGDRTPNGKVGAVLAGACAARHDIVVLADDDVTWTRPQLERAHAVMANTDLVCLRPQNRYRTLTAPARWDTARILIGRAFGGDWPGTMVVRRSALIDDGYRGDVLFENLELERTLAVRGATAVDLALVVDRDPPRLDRFLEQRVRQAYDELARPAHLLAQLAILPTLILGRRRAALALSIGAMALAEVGRRRSDGRSAYTATSALWAPAWVLERSITSWLALACRVRGGVRYRDGRFRAAATPGRRLRRIAADPSPAGVGARSGPHESDR